MKPKTFIAACSLLYAVFYPATICHSQMKPRNFQVTKPVKLFLRGPSAPGDFKLAERGANYLKVSWTDISDGEIGNRLSRSTGGIIWVTLVEFGPIEKGKPIVYEDRGLEQSKKYYYKLEVYGRAVNGTKNDQTIITTQTPALIAYTGEGSSINLFRLQLRIKTSNISNADLDAPLRIEVGHNWGTVLPASVHTMLDRGIDDFERGKNDVYELNFNGLNSLPDIGDIWISNTTTDDRHIIDSVSIIVNNKTVFEKSFGPSGFTLFPYGTLILRLSEMANYSKWKQLITEQAQLANIPLGLQIVTHEGQFAIKIPKEELIARIEGIVGNLICEIPSAIDNIGWQEGSKPVEIMYKAPDKISVDLDFMNYKFVDGPLDADFTLSVAYSCSANNQLVLNMITTKFDFDLDYSFLSDIISLGTLKAFDKLYDWTVNNDSNNKSITKTLKFALPACIDCSKVKVLFNESADLLIVIGSNTCFSGATPVSNSLLHRFIQNNPGSN